MTFVGFLAFTLEVGDFQNPLKQFRKPDPVNFALVKVFAKPFVQRHRDVFMVGPVNGHIVKVVERHRCVNFRVSFLASYRSRVSETGNTQNETRVNVHVR